MAKRKYESKAGGYDPPHLTRLRTTLPGWWLRELRDRYGIRRFVETGTCNGDTSVLAALVFDEVLTVDISHVYDAGADEKLAHYHHVKRSYGDSPEWLKQVVTDSDVPTVYWLDAHWCGQDERLGPECPIMRELAAIGPMRDCDAIICDEADFFVGGPYNIVGRARAHRPEEWPTYDAILALVATWQPTARAELCESMIVITTEAMARFPSE